MITKIAGAFGACYFCARIPLWEKVSTTQAYQLLLCAMMETGDIYWNIVVSNAEMKN